MNVVRRGRGRPVTLFAPGHGRAVDVTEEWVKCLGLKGTRLFFEYERSGHFEQTKGLRRQADRDAFEVTALADERGATHVVGFSRGARAVVGAMVRDPGCFEKVVLVWPPSGWAAGDYASWVGHQKVVPDRVVRHNADVLVVGQHIDSGHPMKMAEQWAWALGAKLEVFPPKGLLWDVHREQFKAVVSAFLR